MVKIRINKDNPEGRTEDTLVLITGEKVKVNDVDWTEIDKSNFEMSSINPILYEIDLGEVAKDVPIEARKKGRGRQ